MKSIYLFTTAVILSIIAINLFVYIDALFYGVICIFVSMVLVEYGISIRVLEERITQSDQYVFIKITELIKKFSKAKSKKDKDKMWNEFRTSIKENCRSKAVGNFTAKKFRDFADTKESYSMIARMEKNGAPKNLIGKETAKKFSKV
ncbi:MAG: hypothetical protein PHW96_03310 [Candidatus Nanoarchaeia archaeon]|nr:hypothetical protein [Candidatus Nanoarchaeia archaeon]